MSRDRRVLDPSREAEAALPAVSFQRSENLLPVVLPFSVILVTPSGLRLDVTSRVNGGLDGISQETEIEMLELTHDDVELEMANVDGYFQTIFKGPELTEGVWRLEIDRQTFLRRPYYERIFTGILEMPWSLEYDRKDDTLTLTAFAYTKLLEQFSAETVQRAAVTLTGSVGASSAIVTSISPNTDGLLPGDRIEFDDETKTEEQVVLSIDSSSQVTVETAFTNAFTTKPLERMTPYYRDKTVRFLAEQLFETAGISQYYIQLDNPQGTFPVPIGLNEEGLPSLAAPASVFVRSGKLIIQLAGTEYEMDAPENGFVTGASYGSNVGLDWSKQFLSEPANPVTDTAVADEKTADHEAGHLYEWLRRPTIDGSLVGDAVNGSVIIDNISPDTDDLLAGDWVELGGFALQNREILSVDSSSQITLTAPWTKTSNNGITIKTRAQVLEKKRNGSVANAGLPNLDRYNEDDESDVPDSYLFRQIEWVATEGEFPALIGAYDRPASAPSNLGKVSLIQFDDATGDSGSVTDIAASGGAGAFQCTAIPGLGVFLNGTTNLRVWQLQPTTVLRASITVPSGLLLQTMRLLDDHVICMYETTDEVRLLIWDAATWEEKADVLLSENKLASADDYKATAWELSSGERVGVIYYGRWGIVSKSFFGTIPYANFEGMSCSDALKELATVSMAYLTTDQLGSGVIKGRAFRGLIEGEDVLDLNSITPLERSVRPVWEYYRNSVEVKGETESGTKIEKRVGDQGTAAARLSIDSVLITFPGMALSIAYQWLGWLNTLDRQEETLVVEEQGEIIRPMRKVRLDGREYRVISADLDLEEREIELRIIEV